MKLFYYVPLTKKDDEILAKNYNGTYNTWTGVLIHIAGMSRPDVVHSIMGLCGYNTRPTMATYKTLNHLNTILVPSSPYSDNVFKRAHEI